MITKFVDRYMAKKGTLEERWSKAHPEGYDEIVRSVIELIAEGGWGEPDPKNIHVIDDGDYQGTRLYIIPADTYQPYTYWYVRVDYGSCSGCDAYEAIRTYSDDTPSTQQTQDYMYLALHIVQAIKCMDEEEE